MDIKDVNTLNVLDSVGTNTSLFLFDSVENYGYQMSVPNFIRYVERMSYGFIGDNEDLATSVKTSIVEAINELKGDIGYRGNLRTSNTTNLVAAINELRDNISQLSSYGTSIDNYGTTLVSIAEDIGNLVNLTTTAKSTGSLVDAINEVNGKIGNLSSLNTTDKSSVVASLNELLSAINNKSSGTLADGTSVTDAIAALRADLGYPKDLNSAISKTNAMAAINDVLSRVVTFENLAGSLSTSSSGSGNGTVTSLGTASVMTGFKVYDTFKTGLLNDRSLAAGNVCLTLGFYNVGDGGGGYYYISESFPPKTANETAGGNFFKSHAVNGKFYPGNYTNDGSLTLFSLVNSSGRVLYPFPLENPMKRNVKQWGAKGDGIQDDWVYIQSCLDHGFRKNGGGVYFPAGQYRITKTLYVMHNTYVYGDGDGEADYGVLNKNQDKPKVKIPNEGSEIAFDPPSNYYTGYYDGNGNYHATDIYTSGNTPGHYAVAVVLFGFENVPEAFSENNKPMFQRDFYNLQIRDHTGRKDTIGIEARNLQNRATIHHCRVENFGYCGLLLDEMWSNGSTPYVYGGNAPAFCAIRDMFIETHWKEGDPHAYSIIIRGGHGPMLIENVGMDCSSHNTIATEMLIVGSANQKNYSLVTLSSLKFEFSKNPLAGQRGQQINAIEVKNGFKGLINIIGCGAGSSEAMKDDKGNSCCNGGAFLNVDATSAANTIVNVAGCVVSGFDYATKWGSTTYPATGKLGSTVARYGFKTFGNDLLVS